MLKFLVGMIAVALLCGCSTTTSRLQNGKTVTLYGTDAEYAKQLRSPFIRAVLDAKGPAPEQWTKVLKEHCSRYPSAIAFSDRLYWAARLHPAAGSYTDKELAYDYVLVNCIT